MSLSMVENAHLSRVDSDKRIWEGDKLGRFSCKAFFDLLINSSKEDTFVPHKIIWKAGVPPKLKDVIWGDTSEGDDHIVPYPDGSEAKPPCLFGDHINKGRNHEAADEKPLEQKKPVARSNFNGGAKQERNSQYDTNEGRPATGFSVDSWPDLSLSNAARTDHDSVATELSDNLVELSEYDSSRGGKVAQLDSVSVVFPQQREDREEIDFVDYDWANIGSFDDLDRIFSKDDPMFGHVSLCNADEIWLPSKNIPTSPEKSFHLSIDSPSLGLGASRGTSDHFEAKAECMLDQDQPGYENVSNLLVMEKTVLDIGMTQPLKPNLIAGTARAPNEFGDKMNGQRKLPKGGKKLEEKSKGRQQFQQVDSQCATTMDQPVPGQQRQLQGPESLQYKNFSNPHYSAMPVPVLPRFFSGESTHQKVPSGYEVPHGNSNPLNKSPAFTVKPPTMTPQEKIEKLRRRQQMRAMLAIQKQQQQFNHQNSCTKHSISKKCLHDSTQMIEIDENPNTIPSLHPLHPTSPIEQDDSSMVCMAIDYCSVEATILRRLQDTIAKLDIQTRLCIRDSLFRLAQSAIQREYTSDTSSINKSKRDVEDLSKGDINSHNRFARVPDAETETNPIDRTVAHLLFHRPLGTFFLPESCPSKQTYKSHQHGLKIPCTFADEGDRSSDSLRN
ncbi:hypothetical protein LguiB_024101 [Lonicera macranthoides]